MIVRFANIPVNSLFCSVFSSLTSRQKKVTAVVIVIFALLATLSALAYFCYKASYNKQVPSGRDNEIPLDGTVGLAENEEQGESLLLPLLNNGEANIIPLARDGFTGEGNFQDPDESVFIGTFVDGFLQEGEIRFQYGNIASAKGKFEREMIREGEILYANGDRAEGKFTQDLLQGKGKFIYEDGDAYEGEFKDGLLHGNGEKRLEDRKLTGEFKWGLLNGKGEISYVCGNKETGVFQNNLLHGKGKNIIAGGQYGAITEIQEGEFLLGKLDGIGSITFMKGNNTEEDIEEILEGEFKSGCFYGEGTRTLATGEEQRGFFVTNSTGHPVMVKGIKTFPGGNSEEGDFSVDTELLTGQGKKIFVTGRKEEGDFNEGDLHGKGTRRLNTGEIFTGIFQDGALIGSLV